MDTMTGTGPMPAEAHVYARRKPPSSMSQFVRGFRVMYRSGRRIYFWDRSLLARGGPMKDACDRPVARCLAIALIAGAFSATSLPGKADRVSGAEPKALQLDTKLEATLAGGQAHEYRLQLRAGEYARLVVEQRT